MTSQSVNRTIPVCIRGDLRTGRSGTPVKERISQLIDEARAAEEMGFHGFWSSEQHAVADNHCGPQLTLLAGIATVTSRLRLMPAALLLPLYPLREVVEQAGIVDLLSDGRLDITVGAGAYDREFLAFGKDIHKRGKMMESLIPQLRRGLHEGQIPDGPKGSLLPVSPRPAQARMAIYGGGLAPAAVDRMVRLGLDGIVLYDHGWPERMIPRLWTDVVIPALERHGRTTDDFRILIGVHMWATEDPERDWERVYLPGYQYAEGRYVEMLNEGTHTDTLPDGIAVEFEPERVLFDTPERIVQRLLALRTLVPFSEVGFHYRLPGISYDDALANLDLISRRVLPHLVVDQATLNV
jgi:alkanesulfonate monooxygenase SsuD/methylene tetrahydromethanopterin reductase-like flavin-dependent oxidoreductase (luciferase family)